MAKPFQLNLDHPAKTPLAVRIRKGIGTAIESGPDAASPPRAASTT
jgi:hypothetical protein